MKELNIYEFPEFKRPLVKAVIETGGQSAFANLLKISPQVVYSWLFVLEKGIPPERCIEVESITEGQITRQHLRPDIFGKDIKFEPLTIEEDLNRTIRRLQKLLKGIVWVDKDRATIRAKPKKGAK